MQNELTDNQILRLLQASLEFNATVVAIATSTIAIKSKQRDSVRVGQELTQAFSEYQRVAGEIAKERNK